MLKRCRKCLIEKGLSSFSKCTANRDGLHFWCKECDRAGRKARRLANPERDIATIQAWRDAHPGRKQETDRLHHERNKEASNAKSRARYWADKEKAQKAGKAWRAKNADLIREANKRKRERDGERIRAKRRQHYQQNKSRYKANARRRDIDKLQATPSWADREAMMTFYAEAERLTKETGVKYHVDHIYPLRGNDSCGLHVPLNLQVIPAIDNLKKSNRMPELA